MNKSSIIFSTTLNYFITIFLLIFASVFLISSEKIDKKEQTFERYKPIIRMVHKQRGNFDNFFINSLKEMNYEIFIGKSIDETLKTKNKRVLFARKNDRESFKIFEIDDKNYILFENRVDRMLIKDLDSFDSSNNFYTIIVFLSLFFVISFLYFRTLKKLKPLKVLKDKVVNLGEENFDFDFKSEKSNDEITLLANEFKNSAKKLKGIKDARNIFIRNIMHELKTPITKGKLLLTLEQNPRNIERLKEVFIRLENLINEFATIEEIISQSKTLQKKSYYLEDLIDEAKDILMLEDENIINSYANIKLEVNFKLFSIAIKNLIDNAIKYSNDKKVEIKTEGNSICFINSGEKLKGDFENYLEPFYGKNQKGSFGLGLYIVFNILKANGYNLFYEYKDDKNIFIIKK
ncbi:ArsS family sensor histidine kinase [Aliarcobacter trophiarum]|uniref:ArsS family sensor histidine kinase n=1 Tax=Aliarcobacter trophiarum TaxID=708186 RepID=UPI00100AA265|nr:ArsS family sensor histidine kinase [Aliarcobacter trophiarum]RXI25307.1 histidine kinase [Aliarcobacter trophiarum]